MAFSHSELSFALTSLVPWEIFATYLPGMTQADIEKIQTDKPGNAEKQKITLFYIWLKVFPGASWSDVVRALKKARENTLALEIELKYVTMDTDTGISSSKQETASTPADGDVYPYHTPVPATTFERSQLESCQQDTQNHTTTATTTTEKHSSDLFEEIDEHLITIDEVSELNKQKKTLKKKNKQLLLEIERLKECLQVAEHRHKTLVHKHREEIKGSHEQLEAETQKHQNALQNERDQQEIKMQIITSEHSDTCQQLQSKNRQLQTELANINIELIEMKTRKEKGINELTARIKETNKKLREEILSFQSKVEKQLKRIGNC